MITVRIQKEAGNYKGFQCSGHAMYAEEGQDIICSAVSILTVNTVNAMEELAHESLEASQRDGFVSCTSKGELSKEGTLLMDTMILGLQSIQEIYGSQYIRLIFEEV